MAAAASFFMDAIQSLKTAVYPNNELIVVRHGHKIHAPRGRALYIRKVRINQPFGGKAGEYEAEQKNTVSSGDWCWLIAKQQMSGGVICQN